MAVVAVVTASCADAGTRSAQLEPAGSASARSPGADTMPCDPGFGAPRPREGCPDPEPDTGWLSPRSDGALTLQPFRTLHNDAQGRRYAETHGVDFPFANDYLDVLVGDPRVVVLDAGTICMGAIRVGYREPLRDHVVDCDQFAQALRHRSPRIPAAVWRDGGRVLQVSELYRP